MKGFSQIWLIAGALMIIIVGGAFYLGKQTSKSVQPTASTQRGEQNQVKTSQVIPSSTPTVITVPGIADETANWKTYTNTSHKYSIKYPPNWQVLELKQFPDSVSFYPPEADMQLIIKVDSGEGTSQEGMDSLKWPSMDVSVRSRPFSEFPLGNKDPFITDWQIVVVDGIEGHFYKTHQCAPKCGVYVVLPLENGQKTLSISASSDADINIFKTMYPTFKFSK